MKRRGASERGASFVETLVAVAILATALVVYLAGMSTGSRATAQVDRLSAAQEVARSQMEDVKGQPYAAAPATYPSVPAPSGYTVAALATDIPLGDPGIQLVTVTVSDSAGVLFTLEGYKVQR